VLAGAEMAASVPSPAETAVAAKTPTATIAVRLKATHLDGSPGLR
jgi:hypothetical protein